MTTDCTTDHRVDTLIDLLRESQARLADTVGALDLEAVRTDSYDDDWSIAQVLSHLGSQTQIYGRIMDAAVEGNEAPGNDVFQPIWDAWNAKDPLAQVRDALAADAAFLERLVSMPTQTRESVLIEVFGAPRTLEALLAMRLAEHVVHTWDVVVAIDPSATLQTSAVDTVLTQVLQFLGFMGRTDHPRSVLVRTSAPDREFVLSIGPDGGAISDDVTRSTDGTLELAAEAFVRLLYGRLDPDHRPAIAAAGVAVDDLTPAFPGF